MLNGILTSWAFNVALYIVFIVIFYQFYRLAVKNVVRDGAATIILQLVAGISILLLFPLFELKFPSSLRTYGILLIACIFYAINDRLNTTVRKNLEVSTYSIISEFSNIFIIIFGITVFREPILPLKILGVGLILLANFFLVYKGGKVVINKYTMLALLAQFVISVAISIDIGISRAFNLPIYISITLIVPLLMIFFVGRHRVSDVADEWLRGNKGYFIITGVSWGLAILFMLRAFRYGQVTTVSPISATSVLVNVIVAGIFLHEKEDLVKKVLIATVIILGVTATAFA